MYLLDFSTMDFEHQSKRFVYGISEAVSQALFSSVVYHSIGHASIWFIFFRVATRRCCASSNSTWIPEDVWIAHEPYVLFFRGLASSGLDGFAELGSWQHDTRLLFLRKESFESIFLLATTSWRRISGLAYGLVPGAAE